MDGRAQERERGDRERPEFGRERPKEKHENTFPS